jgi:nitroreductase
MTLLEAIQARHSVRQYLDKPIEADKLQSLRDTIDLCNREGGTHLQLIIDEPLAFAKSNAPMYGKFVNVRNYIAVLAPKGNEGSKLAGYYGEKVVLHAQTLGLNTCWVGLTFKNIKTAYTIAPGEELKAVISLGYGASQGVQHPQKKSINDVSVNKTSQPLPEWFIKGVEAALLAPTAVNQQKFAFILNADHSVQVQTKFSLIGYTHLDLGIVKCHFELASNHPIL